MGPLGRTPPTTYQPKDTTTVQDDVADDYEDLESTWGLREGQPLAPGYHAWELLAVGKRFEMWAAFSLTTLTPVCVKIPRRDNFTDSALNALRREYAATTACNHPAIPRAYDLQLDRALPHLVLEFIEGDPLGEFIDDHGPMDSEGVVFLGLQLLAALRHVHDRGFVHHDLKPANIMVRGDRPIIVDFDLALPIGAQRSRTKPRGTHGYMSPEQIRCAPASPMMDLFAVGAVMYRAATGVSPFRSKRPSASSSQSTDDEQPRRYVQLEGGRSPIDQVAADLAPSVAEAIEELLTVDPRRRPATADAAIKLLTDAWAGHGEPLWPDWVTDKIAPSSHGSPLTQGTSRTKVVTGDGVALNYCTSMSPTNRSRCAVIVDRQLQHGAAVRDLCAAVTEAPSATVIAVDSTDDDLESLNRLATRLTTTNANTIVTIGGAATHDIARLAALLVATADDPIAAFGDPGPRGLLQVVAPSIQIPSLIAIPTTLGTGVEVSPIACFTHAGIKRMVSAPQLQPATALLDPAMTESLPEVLVEHGLVEAMLRYVGPLLAGPSHVPTADSQALVEVAALAQLLTEHRDGSLSSDQRLEAAIRSANTRQGYALTGRDPFGSKLWYLATALTDLAPISKVDAHLTLLPAMLQRIVDGDGRFGDIDQLMRVAGQLGTDSPVHALQATSALINLFGPPTVVNQSFPASAVLAAHANRVWGDGQPMLGVFTQAELANFYEGAFATPAALVVGESAVD